MMNAAITPAAEAALEVSFAAASSALARGQAHLAAKHLDDAGKVLESGEGPWWDLLQTRQDELYGKHPELMFGA